jgi:DNA-directed RNA polymerase subunit RPC12/RpoP
MANILITCPKCKKQLPGPAELQGKKIRCKSCGQAFVVKAAAPTKGAPAKTVPASQPGKAQGKTKAAAAPPPPKAPDESEVKFYKFADGESAPAAPPLAPTPLAQPGATGDPLDKAGKNPYKLGDVIESVARCPQCAFELESEEAIICFKCGYNVQTRTRTTTVKVYDHTFRDWAYWLAPGIFYALIALAAIGGICYLWLGIDSRDENGKMSGVLFAAQVWGSVIACFILWTTGRFAFRRLVLNPHPPEKLKH